MSIKILFFLLLFVVIYSSGYYLVYFSTVRLFGIEKMNIKFILGLITIFFAFSFILSSVFAHWHDVLFTRVYYITSAVAFGLFVNLLVMFCLAWLVVWLSKISGFEISKVFIATVFSFIALFLSCYGIWGAFNPKIKNIEVGINNLPDYWDGRTIIQLSDVHLGTIHRLFSARKIAGMVNSIDHDLVLITGDLFDGQAGDLNCFVDPLNDIRAKDGIYFITGNHETYYGTDKIYEILSRTKIKILNDELVDLNGLKLLGVSYPERIDKKNIINVIKGMEGYNPNDPNVLIYHEPVVINGLSQIGINLQLAGHTHRMQIWPFGYITKLMYKGYDYGFFNKGDYNLYTSTGVGTWGPPMRTFNRGEIVAIKLLKK